MTIQLELPSELEAHLHEQAARHGQAADDYVRQVVERELVAQALLALKSRTPPQSVADLEARIPSPAGTSWLAYVRGEWPGDEADEEIFQALDEMS